MQDAPYGEPTPTPERTPAGDRPPAPGQPTTSGGEGDAVVGMVGALAALRTALAGTRLPLELPGAAADRRSLAQLLDHIDDYLLPRIRQMGAPLLAVVGGSTGAGKSTLVNSLLQATVTTPGVLRPTTRAPVLVHHPDDAAWFTSDRVLPHLARVTGDRPGARTGALHADRDGGARALRLVGHGAVPRGLALLDAPDIDSVVEENRELGEELLGAADLWLFVTTAARYADAVPWDLLTAAARRSAVVTMVLNRVEPRARDAVAAHLSQMLDEHGLTGAELFTVPESDLSDGMLPPRVVAEVVGWLRSVAGDTAARQAVVRRAVRGAVDDVVTRAPGLAAAADAQVDHVERLRAVALTAYTDAERSLDTATSDGTLLRGEVLARWQEFVGTGELLRAVETKVSTFRDRAAAFVRGRPAPEPVAAAIGHGLVDLVVDAADRAADRTDAAWRADPAAGALLDGLRLSRSSPDLRERVNEQVRAWQRGVLDLVATEGADRRTAARALSFGVNGLGAALMVAIFASTGGLTAAEVGVAGGTAVLAQRLLEAVFGDDAVRRLTRTAQADLAARMANLLRSEASRFTTVLDALDLTPGAGAAVRAAATEVARRSSWLGDGAGDEAPARRVEHGPVTPESRFGPDDDDRLEPEDPSTLRRWWTRLWQD